MIPQNYPPQFPSQDVIDDIRQLPQFNADASSFVDKTPAEIADYVRGQEGQIILNASNVSIPEMQKFTAANQILKQSGDTEIVLYNEKKKVDEITYDISYELVGAPLLFRLFIKKLLEKPQDFIDEYNTYAVPRGASFEDLHYWGNVGLEDTEDTLRAETVRMFDDMKEEVAAITEKVLPHLDANPHIIQTRDQINTLLLGMFSNMVRGIFYKYANAKKVYGLRKLAVDTIDEFYQSGKGATDPDW